MQAIKTIRIGLALLLIANLSSVLITDDLPTDPAWFGKRPFHAHTLFEIIGEPEDPSRWTSAWGPNRPGKPQHHSQTEVELRISHGVRDVSEFVQVEILADSQADADALMSLLESDFSQAYRPAGPFEQATGRQHLEDYNLPTRFYWRQRFELLLIANIIAIICLLSMSIVFRKAADHQPPTPS